MKFTLLTPQRTLFDGDVESVVVPGAEGYVGFLEGHVPFVTPLKTGVVEVIAENNSLAFAVKGGYFEYSSDGMVVLAENAEKSDEIDYNQALELKKKAEELYAHPPEDANLDRLLADVEHADVRLEIATK